MPTSSAFAMMKRQSANQTLLGDFSITYIGCSTANKNELNYHQWYQSLLSGKVLSRVNMQQEFDA